MRSVPVGAVEGAVAEGVITAVAADAAVAVTTPPAFSHGHRYAIKLVSSVSSDPMRGYLLMGPAGTPPTATALIGYPIVEGETFIWCPREGWDAASFIRVAGSASGNVHVNEIDPDPV